MVQMDILIADDDEPSRLYLELVLRSLGHSPTAVADGTEALSVLESFSFDVILLDIEMANLGGLATVRLIRNHPAMQDLPVYAITANTAESRLAEIASAGFHAVLSKPCRPEQLQLLLSGQLGGLPAASPRSITDQTQSNRFRELLAASGVCPEPIIRRTLDAVDLWIESGPLCQPDSQTAAHSLAGSCAVIAAAALSAALRHLEDLALNGQSQEWGAALSATANLLLETRRELISSRCTQLPRQQH